MASNDRRNPFTGATAWVAISAETRTIAEFDEFPGIYGFQLLERPRQESLVLYEPGSGGRIFTLVSTAPNVGEARVDYDSGICQFNIADNSLPVLADYDGGGSPTNIENISLIATFTGRTTDDLDEGAVNKYFSGKDSDDLPEGATNLYLTSDNLGDTINAATAQATPNDSGKVGFWDATTSALRQLTFTQLKAFLKTYFDTVYEASPAGLIQAYAGSTTPTGYFLCDGAAYSRATYSALFSAIGTTWGAGNGSTTFNVPDFRGIFLRGVGNHGTLTKAGGSAFAGGTLGTYANDKLQGHWHSYRDTGGSGANAGIASNNAISGTLQTASSGAINNPISDGTNGTPRTGDETAPASAAVNFIIKY